MNKEQRKREGKRESMNTGGDEELNCRGGEGWQCRNRRSTMDQRRRLSAALFNLELELGVGTVLKERKLKRQTNGIVITIFREEDDDRGRAIRQKASATYVAGARSQADGNDLLCLSFCTFQTLARAWKGEFLPLSSSEGGDWLMGFNWSLTAVRMEAPLNLKT